MTIASVTFGTTKTQPSLHVRNIDTPATMSDRIPPTATTPLYVNVSPDLSASGGESITLAVTGDGTPGTGPSAKNGSATLNGSKSPITITKAQTVVALVGTAQTAAAGVNDPNNLSAPNARKLFLTVTAHGALALRSKGLSVAAMPIGLIEKFDGPSPVSDGERGIVVSEHWISDSGNAADLGGVDWFEQIQIDVGSETGIFVGKPNPEVQQTWLAATQSTTDDHSIPAARAHASGYEAVYQSHIFRDRRTGANSIVIPHSGFVITHTVWKYKSIFEITTTLAGTSVVANTFASTAGYIDDHGQPIICFTEG